MLSVFLEAAYLTSVPGTSNHGSERLTERPSHGPHAGTAQRKIKELGR